MTTTPITSVSEPGGEPARPRAGAGPKYRRTLFDRMEVFVARLTTRSTFWHRVASLVWLPYAFKSGIKIKRLGSNAFSAVLPFRRFNRNWYNAMAGASLLANAEIAGGMYIYGITGGDYTVVCKELRYRFLRPCFGPAVYRVNAEADLGAMLKAGGEFNYDITMDVVQQIPTRGLGREVRVGRCWATFHVTPKAMHQARKARRGRAAAGGGQASGGAPHDAGPTPDTQAAPAEPHTPRQGVAPSSDHAQARLTA